MAWGFGHIASGMYDGQGNAKAYSQLASVQLGSLEEAGALEWKADLRAANGTDTGCFEIHFEPWDAAATALAQRGPADQGAGESPGWRSAEGALGR